MDPVTVAVIAPSGKRQAVSASQLAARWMSGVAICALAGSISS